MSIIQRSITFVKEHPAGIAGGVFALVVLYLIARRNSAPAAQQYANPNAVSPDVQVASINAGAQLSAIQSQAAEKQFEVAAQQDIANKQVAASVTVAQLQAQTGMNANNLTAQTAQILAGFQTQTQQVVATLQAQVENNKTAAATAQTASNNATFSSINASNVQAQTSIANTNAATTLGIVEATTQQIGINGIIHTAPQNQRELGGRALGYTGAFGAGGLDAYLSQNYGTLHPNVPGYGVI